MSNWTDLLNDPRAVRAIFGDHVPSLSGVELFEVVVNHDNLHAVLRFDLQDYPADPPPKWSAQGFNRVQVELKAWGLQEVLVDVTTTRTTTVDISVVRDGALTRVRGIGDGVLIDLRADFVDVSSAGGLSAYLNVGDDEDED